MKLTINKEEFVNKTFRINKKIGEKMKKICMEKRISLNKIANIFIRYALDNLEL